MRTQYNPNIEETEFILTAEEMKDNDISIRVDERAKVIESVIEDIIPTLCECDVDEEEIENCKRRLEQMKEVRNG